MTKDLIKCYGIENKVHHFEFGVDQALIFPDLLENKVEIEEEIDNMIGNINEFVNKYIIKDLNGFFKLKDAKEIYQKSEYFNGHVGKFKKELEEILNTKCIDQKRINSIKYNYVFQGYSFKK